MSKQPQSKTDKFKKSTARYVRDELTKTKHSFTHSRSFAIEIGAAVVIALGASFGYVWLINIP